MTKGQMVVSQVFLYSLAAITFALILIFGYKVIHKVMVDGDNVALIELRQKIQSAVNSIGSSPDVEKRVLNIPSKYRKLCFVASATDAEKQETCLCTKCAHDVIVISGVRCCFASLNESDYSPEICNAWKTGTDQNVFLVPRAEVKIAVNNITMDKHYLCIPVYKGKVTLRLEGQGDSTRISAWV